MMKVSLFCANGFTSAMIRNKIREAAKKRGLDYEVEAYPYAEIGEEGARSDVILLGPQIRYNLKHVQETYPDKPVILLDMQTWGSMNGDKVVEQIQELEPAD